MTFSDVPIVYAKGDIELGWGPVDYFLYELKSSEAKSHVTFCEWRWYNETGNTDFWGLNKLTRFWESRSVKVKFVEK